MDDMFKAMKDKSIPVKGMEKDAKMHVLKQLLKKMYMMMCEDEMSSPDKPEMPEGMEQVSVSAENPEDLQKGLEMAKDVVSKVPDMEMEEDEEEYI